ncbi:MAG: hypothetical protein JNJ50_03330 [Acidobacteria bacterium]|nr:hypothetical protein [Acidobacteriota bacterium]
MSAARASARAASAKLIRAADYYRIPVLEIYKGYPIYVLGKEPPGYLESHCWRHPSQRAESF